MTDASDFVSPSSGRDWTPPAYALAAVATAFLVGSIAHSAFDIVAADASPLSRQAARYLALHGVGFAGVTSVYLRLRGLDLSYLRIETPDAADAGWTAVATAAVVAIAYGLVELYGFLGVESAEHSVESEAAVNPEIYLLLVALSLLLIGPAEELLFRGVLQNAFEETVSSAGAVTAASLVFAAVHYTALSGSAFEVAVFVFTAFLLSLALGAAYLLSNSLLVPAAAHGAYNALVFYSAYSGAV